MSRYLIAFDGGETAQSAFRWLLSHADPTKDHIDILTSIIGSSKNLQETETKDLFAEASNMLESAASLAKEKNFKIDTHVAVGDPADTICEFAERLHTDFVVLGKKTPHPISAYQSGLGFFGGVLTQIGKRMFGKDTTELVVKNCTCTVILPVENVEKDMSLSHEFEMLKALSEEEIPTTLIPGNEKSPVNFASSSSSEQAASSSNGLFQGSPTVAPLAAQFALVDECTSEEL